MGNGKGNLARKYRVRTEEMLGLEQGRQGAGSDCGGWEVWSSLEGVA